MTAQRKLLKNQVAIVTGANSGIGEGVARAMAEAGAAVVVNYVADENAAFKIVDEIKAAGGDAIAIHADISNEVEVVSLFAQTIETYGTVHILVNNAGLQRDAAITEMSLAEWQKVIDVNLTGQFLCAREAAKEFIRRGVDESVSLAAGKIIHMGSVHQVVPWAGHCNYAASKGGIVMLMQSLAQELAPKRIRVNAIGPGAIQTPINESVWTDPAGMEKLMELIPYKRIGQPADIGKAAVWLASDDSDYVSGDTLFVDGGMTCYPGFATGG